MTTVLECPLCRTSLLCSARSCRCLNNHSFDAAREGYVNLLPVQKKHSRDPGDSKEMIQSRRRFLELGLYNGISDGISQAAARALSGERGGLVNILDAGCGEGFYLTRLREFLARQQGNREFYGTDISKSAARYAARRDRAIRWFVASNRDLPFAKASFDLILNVFSPPSFPEFSRVLRKDGKLVMVTPGPRHLNGLRQIIYTDPREHPESEMDEEGKEYFEVSSENRITYRIELKSGERIMDLLSMTPYFWNIDLKTKARIEALTELVCDADVEIRVLRKKR